MNEITILGMIVLVHIALVRFEFWIIDTTSCRKD